MVRLVFRRPARGIESADASLTVRLRSRSAELIGDRRRCWRAGSGCAWTSSLRHAWRIRVLPRNGSPKDSRAAHPPSAGPKRTCSGGVEWLDVDADRLECSRRRGRLAPTPAAAGGVLRSDAAARASSPGPAGSRSAAAHRDRRSGRGGLIDAASLGDVKRSSSNSPSHHQARCGPTPRRSVRTARCSRPSSARRREVCAGIRHARAGVRLRASFTESGEAESRRGWRARWTWRFA